MADESELHLDPIVTPSGMFVSNEPSRDIDSLPRSINPYGKKAINSVFNPMPIESKHEVISEQQLDSKSFECAMKEAKVANEIKRADVEDYALMLYGELVPSILEKRHDLLIFPLRGCRQPGIVAKAMLDLPASSVAVINFTYNWMPCQEEQIQKQLLSQLSEKLPEKQTVSIGILDTADSGKGALRMAGFLQEAKGKFNNQDWQVQFHLIHRRSKLPREALCCQSLSKGRVSFDDPLFYPVDDLQFEDWDDGLGLKVEVNGDVHELKRCKSPGLVLLRDHNKVQLFHSEQIDELLTSYVVKAVNEIMLNDDSLTYIKDVWQLREGVQ